MGRGVEQRRTRVRSPFWHRTVDEHPQLFFGAFRINSIHQKQKLTKMSSISTFEKAPKHEAYGAATSTAGRATKKERPEGRA